MRHSQAACIALVSVLLSSSVRADDDTASGRVFARVIVEKTMLRSGPGVGYRGTYLAKRGEVFPIVERSTRGFWFQVELPDATVAWVMGDAVYNEELSDDDATNGRFLPWLFAPPPLPGAHAELTISAGVLGNGGMMAIRPTVLMHPTFGFEGTIAASVASGGRLYLAGLGGIINVFPESPIVPFFCVGGGVAVSDPNADTFLLQSGSTAMMYGGGGLRFGFRARLTLRIDFRAYAFYEPDRYATREEVTGGLSVFF